LSISSTYTDHDLDSNVHVFSYAPERQGVRCPMCAVADQGEFARRQSLSNRRAQVISIKLATLQCVGKSFGSKG
jgi:hypothetical protein